MNKIIRLYKAIINRLFLKPYFRSILGHLGDNTNLPSSTRLDNPQNIYLGNKVCIGRFSRLSAIPMTGLQKTNLTIGDKTYIGSFAHIFCTSQIKIGENVLIADRVYISDNQHSYEDIEKPIISQPILQLNNVHVGDGTWIGENVCIIGANIGKQCVIGANSVVTKSIPDYCVAVGSPAKIVKRYSFEQNAWLRTDSNGNFK